MGIGTAEGKGRARDAAIAALSSPLIDFPISQATGIVFTITGASDMTLQEVNEAAEAIYEMSDPDANIIFGAQVRPGQPPALLCAKRAGPACRPAASEASQPRATSTTAGAPRAHMWRCRAAEAHPALARLARRSTRRWALSSPSPSWRRGLSARRPTAGGSMLLGGRRRRAQAVRRQQSRSALVSVARAERQQRAARVALLR